jgi:hypothetical protein
MKGESIPPHTVWSGIPAQHTPPGGIHAASKLAPGSVDTSGTGPQKAA